MISLIPEGYQKSTSDIPEHERFDYWRDMICDEFVKLDCEKVKQGSFVGQIRGGVGVSSLRFSEVISDPQLVRRSKRQIAKSTEEEFLISFQLVEQGLVRQDGREALLKPGYFALYDSSRPYTLTFKKRFHQFIVQMPKDVLSRHLMEPEKYTAIPISGTCGLGAILCNFIFSLAKELHHVRQAPEELSENLVNMIAMSFSSSLMLKEAVSQSVIRDSVKRRVRQFIDNNLYNPDLTNTQIAQSQGISTRYLHKLFEDDEHSIHSLILEKRMQKAQELLNDSTYQGHSIEKIAYSLGFSSPAHFSRVFKKRFGLSPSESKPE
ncbi:MAG: helix-turn-helix domain-containing protein [Pseudomonadales bacterium]|nr:helix-turn-helix domain-containing protein [Pseudomonadales bacterium]